MIKIEHLVKNYGSNCAVDDISLEVGEGEIVAVRGAESNLIITVRFATAGNKDLAAALAPLEIIG